VDIFLHYRIFLIQKNMERIDFEITYQKQKVLKNGRVLPVKKIHTFFYPTNPKEINIKDYQKFLSSIDNLPNFVAVLLGFKKIADFEAVEIEDNFYFENLSDADTEEFKKSIITLLCPVLKKSEHIFELPCELSDFDFFFADGFDDYFPVYFFGSLLADIWENISNVFIWKEIAAAAQDEAREMLMGKNTFSLDYEDPISGEVTQRKFCLPDERLKDYVAKLYSSLLDTEERGQPLNKLIESLQAQIKEGVNLSYFPVYNAWQATTALTFDELRNNGSIEESKAIAALLAALCLEIETEEPLTFKSFENAPLEQMEKETLWRINAIENTLDMHQAHYVNFFFRATFLHTKTHIE